MNVPVYSLKKVSFRVEAKEEPILDDVSLDIFPNDFIILLGSNGSGKSSLIKILNGISLPTSGTVTYRGKDLLKIPLHKRTREIVTLTQDLNLSTFSGLTVLENCLIALHRNKRASFMISSKKERALISSHLTDYNPHLCKNLDESVSILSGGERQSLSLALAMWNTPSLLLLDEHTSALDPHRGQKLMELTHQMVKEKKIPTLMTTHNLQDALAYGNRLIVMKKGKIVLDLNTEEKSALTYAELRSLY